MIGRRTFVGGSLALLASLRHPAMAAPSSPFEAIRATLGPGGRLGVSALDTGSGRRIRFDADSRYALCSTFKMPLAALVLARVGEGALSLSDPVHFTKADLIPYAPVVRANLDKGVLSVEQLTAAIVEVSDNSAANLLLQRTGGPKALTNFMRRCGDRVSRLDRPEPDLGTNLPGDPRDTTAPDAMLGLMRTLLIGSVLSEASRTRLISWMRKSVRGLDRLRAGLPSEWTAGDKTGSGDNGARNDIAIAWPPNRRPVLIACYLSGGSADDRTRNAAHAAVAREIVKAFA